MGIFLFVRSLNIPRSYTVEQAAIDTLFCYVIGLQSLCKKRRNPLGFSKNLLYLCDTLAEVTCEERFSRGDIL